MLCFALATLTLGPATAQPLSPSSLRATVEKLASWHTRNTSTPQLEEAANWVADQFRAIPGMQVELFHYAIHPGPRIPAERDVVEVIARLPATLPEQGGLVVMGGHLDSINMQADPMTGRAPGANDDASGVAATLDTARQMAGVPRSHPTMFVAFSGEEQGLLGSEALAAHAAQEGWKIDAVLSNDIIGNSRDLLGRSDPNHIRLFSEESPRHNSRELARWIEWLERTHGPHGFGVKLVFRSDRFGRDGDHSSFNRHGFTAVRFVDVYEEYTRQHTDKDLPEPMDFDHLAKVASLNDLVMRTLATAGTPPSTVRVDRRQSHDTKLTWTGAPGTRYMVYWRATTESTWSHWKEVGAVDQATFPLVSKDDNIFAVGAVGGIPVPAAEPRAG